MFKGLNCQTTQTYHPFNNFSEIIKYTITQTLALQENQPDTHLLHGGVVEKMQ